MSIKHHYKDKNGKIVQLTSELNIPKGAFKGSLTFDMIFDLDNYAMELYPSPFTFDKPVELSMYFYGLDLSELEGYDIDFNYLDGEADDLECYYKEVNIQRGNLVVWGAKLNHFSRYDWTRLKR